MLERIANFADSLLFVAFGFMSMWVVVDKHYPLWFGVVLAFVAVLTVHVIRLLFRGRE